MIVLVTDSTAYISAAEAAALGVMVLPMTYSVDAQAPVNERYVDDNGDFERLIREKIAEVATQGYCAGKNIVMPGIAGMAAPIPSATRAPYMTVSISAVEDRLHAERVQELAPQLLKSARDMSLFID